MTEHLTARTVFPRLWRLYAGVAMAAAVGSTMLAATTASLGISHLRGAPAMAVHIRDVHPQRLISVSGMARQALAAAPPAAAAAPLPNRTSIVTIEAGAATPPEKVLVPAPPPPPPLTYTWDYTQAHPSPDLQMQAGSAIVVDLDSKRVLAAYNQWQERAPASLTKIMTALVALDHSHLDTTVHVGADSANQPPDSTVMGLRPGQTVTVRDLLYGVFLASGNDAADTLSRGFVSRDRFLAEMNTKAEFLGLQNTHFMNPTGLDQGGHHSSAYDLAIMAGYLEITHPEVVQLSGQVDVTLGANAGHAAIPLHTLNRMTFDYPGLNGGYPGATGLKTGFTDDAGGCVVVTATRGGHHLIAVVMHSDYFFTDAGRLLDYGFRTLGQ